MKVNFTLRDLFWLTWVLGLAIGWWMEAAKNRHERAELQKMQIQVELERAVIQVVGKDATPWMVAATALSPAARQELNAAYLAYENAPPEQQEKLREDALAAIGGAKGR